MFIYSAKLNKKKLAAILIGAAAVILILILVLARGGHSETDHDAQRDEQLKLLQSSRLETNEERLTLLTALGWDVSGQPAEEVEVRIPSEFSEVYEKYNLIQKEQGLNLEKHRGEKAMRYTYQIVNHPSGETNVRATLLIRNNKLIGGDVCSTRLDGFMHTLLMPDGVNTLKPAQTDASAATDVTTVPDASAGAVLTAELPAGGGDEAAFPTD